MQKGERYNLVGRVILPSPSHPFTLSLPSLPFTVHSLHLLAVVPLITLPDRPLLKGARAERRLYVTPSATHRVLRTYTAQRGRFKRAWWKKWLGVTEGGGTCLVEEGWGGIKQAPLLFVFLLVLLLVLLVFHILFQSKSLRISQVDHTWRKKTGRGSGGKLRHEAFRGM